jgi:predicted nucleic acid-binding protein
MSKILVLDTGPAGKIAQPSVSPDVRQWLQDCAAAGDRFVLPEIVDYEPRRNFLLEIRRGRTSFARSLQRLDQLRGRLIFLPLNSEAMLKAAELWAESRSLGKPTADPKELDGDVILAAQALQIGGTVVTENPGHLALFVRIERWIPG